MKTMSNWHRGSLMLTVVGCLVTSGSNDGWSKSRINMRQFSFSTWMCLALGLGMAWVSGCSSCKPGKLAKPKAYHVTVSLDASLQQGSVVVDVIAVSPAGLPRWENYSVNNYWKEGDVMRADADKFSMSFVSGKSLTNELGRADAKWGKWLAQGATHLVVLADLPGGRADKPGTQDERRQIVPLDPCHWPNKTTNLVMHVQRSGINVLTPPRPAK